MLVYIDLRGDAFYFYFYLFLLCSTVDLRLEIAGSIPAAALSSATMSKSFTFVTKQYNLIPAQAGTLPFHLTVCKAMVIVWRLRGTIMRTVSYCHHATSSISTVKKNCPYSPVGSWGWNDLSLCLCMFCFTLDSWVIFFHVSALT